MTMPRIRFTVRRSMILVAIVAIALGLNVYRVRRDTFRREVARHGRAAAWYQWAIDYHPTFLKTLRDDGVKEEDMWRFGTGQEHVLHRDHHVAMLRTYRRAFARFWLAVEPDPDHVEPVGFPL